MTTIGVPRTEAPDHYLTHSTGVMSWLGTLDHKRIGIMYLVSVLVSFFIAGMFGILIRIGRRVGVATEVDVLLVLLGGGCDAERSRRQGGQQRGERAIHRQDHRSALPPVVSRWIGCELGAPVTQSATAHPSSTLARSTLGSMSTALGRPLSETRAWAYTCTPG